MLNLASTNSARVSWGDKYSLQKKEKKKSVYLLLSAPLLTEYFKMFNIWDFLLHLH